jgi:hypothetical protein
MFALNSRANSVDIARLRADARRCFARAGIHHRYVDTAGVMCLIAPNTRPERCAGGPPFSFTRRAPRYWPRSASPRRRSGPSPKTSAAAAASASPRESAWGRRTLGNSFSWEGRWTCSSR